MEDFQIGTLNLNGARDSQKKMCLFAFIKQKHIEKRMGRANYSCPLMVEE